MKPSLTVSCSIVAGAFALVGCSTYTPVETSGAVLTSADAKPNFEARAPSRDAILDVIDALFLALAAGDADAFEALHAPGARTISMRLDKKGAIRYGLASDFGRALRSGKASPVIEPYWSPIVLQRKSLAVVWAPYQVSVGEKLIHCGVDVINLSRHIKGDQARWLIDSVSWTAEPSACEELWPEDKSVFRPEFPEKN